MPASSGGSMPLGDCQGSRENTVASLPAPRNAHQTPHVVNAKLSPKPGVPEANRVAI